MKFAVPGLTLVLAALCTSVAQAQALPVAPVRTVSDTYFGTTIADPYRWMENESDPAVKFWFKGQADYTNSILSRLPGRAALLARIAALDNADVAIQDVQVAEGRYFYRKAAPGDVNSKLYVREGLNGSQRMLLDPQALTAGSAHYSIDYFAPSPDGKLVAVGVSPGGSEASTMRLLKTADGSEVGERIDRTDYAAVSWADGRSFFYSRLQQLGPNDSPIGKYQKSVTFRHMVGDSPDKDVPVFGFGLAPDIPFALDDVPEVIAIPGSSYVFGIVAKGVQNENAVFYAPRKAVKGAATPWRRLADFSDDVVAIDENGAPAGLATHGDDVYLLTHKDAPRYKIVRTSLKNPDLAHADVVVPAADVVIRTMGQAKDALYVQGLDGGLGHVRRIPWGGSQENVSLPFQGSASLLTDPRRDGALLALKSWTRPPSYYRYDPAHATLTDTGLAPPSVADFSGITSSEVAAVSADGTSIPLSLVYKKGLRLDGTHPTLLEGYGSYGITIEPSYSPTALAWLERGGVLAFAHVRGGGEYGEDWHLGGKLLTKNHTWEDFIACGQYLVDNGYTLPTQLGGSGTSAGGITVGRALTERPGLFAAILDRVGSSNPLRAEFTPNGPGNVPEFGTVTDPDGFKALYAMDAYQHVRDGVKYPAVLLTTGINDPRVASWAPAKMAARLQAASTSGKPVLLRVDYDAGHGISSTKPQQDADEADEWSFLLWQFGESDFQPK